MQHSLSSTRLGTANALNGSICCDVEGLDMLLPRIDGSRRAGRVSAKPSKLRSIPVPVTVNGVPCTHLNTIDRFHPPSTWPRTPRSLSKNGFRYVPKNVKRCGV